MFFDLDRDCSGKSTHVHNGDYSFRKINQGRILGGGALGPPPPGFIEGAPKKKKKGKEERKEKREKKKGKKGTKREKIDI